MGRRSGGGGGGFRSSAPSAPLRSRRSASPTPPVAPKAAPGATPQGPGLMGQMAATAGGVAIGSAIGHSIGNMFGGGRQEDVQPGDAYNNDKQYQQQLQALSQPCEFEWRQFMECTQNQNDLSVCQSFNDVFKQCKNRVQEQK